MLLMVLLFVVVGGGAAVFCVSFLFVVVADLFVVVF